MVSWRVVAGLGAFAKCLGDAALGKVLLPGEALGVDAEQHVDAVPGPLGDLSRSDAAVEPGGQARMAQVVGPPG
jgi:hypothetical protein